MTEHTRNDITAFMEFPIRVRNINAPLAEALDLVTELLIDTLETVRFERYFSRFLPDGMDILDFDGLDINYYMVDPLNENGELSYDPSSLEQFLDWKGRKVAYKGSSGMAANDAAYAIMSAMEFLLYDDVKSAKQELAVWLRSHLVGGLAEDLLEEGVLGYLQSEELQEWLNAKE